MPKTIVYELDVDVLKAVASYEGMYEQVSELIKKIHEADEMGSEKSIEKMTDLQKVFLNAQFQANMNNIQKQLDGAEKLLRQRYDQELKLIDRNDKEARERIKERHEQEMRIIEEQRQKTGISAGPEAGKGGPTVFGKSGAELESAAGMLGIALAAIGVIQQIPGKIDSMTKQMTGIETHTMATIPILGFMAQMSEWQKFMNTDMFPIFRSLAEISMATGESFGAVEKMSEGYQKALAQMSDDALVNARQMGATTQEYIGAVGILRREGLVSFTELPQMAMETIGIAKQTGQSISEVASGIADLVLRWNVPQQEAARAYLGMTQEAKQAGMPIKDFQKSTASAEQSLARFGYSIYNAGGLVSNFGEDLNKHRISLGELVNMFTQAAETPAGPQLMMLQRLADTPGLQQRAPALWAALQGSGALGDAIRMRGFGEMAAGGELGRSVQKEYNQLLVSSMNEMMSGLVGEGDAYGRMGMWRMMMPLWGQTGLAGAPVGEREKMLRILGRGPGGIAMAAKSEVNQMVEDAKIIQTQLRDAGTEVDIQRRAGLIQAAQKGLEIMGSKLRVSTMEGVGAIGPVDLWGVPGLGVPRLGVGKEQTPEEIIRGMETQLSTYATVLSGRMAAAAYGMGTLPEGAMGMSAEQVLVQAGKQGVVIYTDLPPQTRGRVGGEPIPRKQ